MKKTITKTKKIKDLENKLEEIKIENELENHLSNHFRARSITVGTVFGGTSEIMMRGDGNRHMYVIMQPVEVIELINQLAANIGCHIAIRPRDDFGSWREWRISEAEKKHLNGHVPFVNDMAVFQQLGASGFNQKEAEETMNTWLQLKQYANPDAPQPDNLKELDNKLTTKRKALLKGEKE